MQTAFERARERAEEHARLCGLDMAGRLAMPLWVGLSGAVLAHEILHPETLEVLVPAGQPLTAESIATAIANGLDYVTVEADSNGNIVRSY